MSADNTVLLFILVWTFMTVCQADQLDGCSVTCQNVTGFVGKEVTLTCSVSQQCTKCCITHYLFRNTKRYDSEICKQEVPYSSCEQRHSLTCSYTPTEMTEIIRFFGQAKCGTVFKLFTVDTTGFFEYRNPESPSGTSPPETAAGVGYKFFVIATVVGCFILIIIIIMTIIRNKKERRMFLCIRHDDDNTTHPEDVI